MAYGTTAPTKRATPRHQTTPVTVTGRLVSLLLGGVLALHGWRRSPAAILLVVFGTALIHQA
jgi:hypothetical protein